MTHRIFGRKLGRDTGERKALFRSLASALILYDRVKTTRAKAEVIRPIVEKIITRARTADIASRRSLYSYLTTKEAYQKLFDDVVKRFKGRSGGYTRIIKLGRRMGDAAPMARIEFVAGPIVKETRKPPSEDAKDGQADTLSSAKNPQTRKRATRRKER